MKYSKILVFALALSIAAMNFTACNKSGDSSSAADQSSNVQISSKETDIDDSLSSLDLDFTANDIDVGYDEANATKIVFEADTPSVSGSGASADGKNVTVTSAGCYIVTGVVSDGQIIIDAGENDKIQLVLDNASLTCKTGPAVYIKSADKVFVTLADGTHNVLSDTDVEYSADGDISPDAVVFSKADLTFNGTGTLEINAGYKHGIVSKDDLVFTGGSYTVTAAKTAIEGKDCVKIADGSFTIDSGTNGIVSSNDEDTDRGFVYIAGGEFDITAGTDGIQAETILTVEDGTFKIVTGGGAKNAQSKGKNDFGGGKQGGGFGGQGGEMPQMPDGTPPDMQGDFGGRGDRQQGDMPQGEAPEPFEQTAASQSADDSSTLPLTTASNEQQSDMDNTSSTSMKALKAGTGIAISGGSFNVDSADDAVHTNGNAVISGGELTLSTGDDGIHADEIIEISSGKINITKSYEGIEAKYINVSGGEVSVIASDDGFNASDGSGENFGGMGGFGGRGMQQQNTDNTQAGDTPYLKISGGTVYVNADGDGLDSNGDIVVEGGDITVYGPTNGGNGALDKGDGNYSLTVTGGTLAAFGAVGMEEGFTDNSAQVSFLHNFSSSVSANTEVTVKDSNGNVIASYKPDKSWQSMVFTSPKLKQGDTVTITAGSVSETVTLDSINTSNSTSNGGFGGGFGGRGGRQ